MPKNIIEFHKIISRRRMQLCGLRDDLDKLVEMKKKIAMKKR